MKSFLLFAVIGTLFFVAGCNDDSGVVTPQFRITSISPNQITAGHKDAELEIAGSGFTSITGVSCGNDINVESFQLVDSSLIRITIDVDIAATPGPRTITVVTSTGSTQLNAGLSIVENRKPTASFTVQPASGTQGTVFTFDAGDSSDPEGRIKKYHWDFGDGSTSTKPVAQYSFPQTGNHTITLTITDDARLKDSTRESVKVDFDLNVAKKQIDAVCREFLNLFAQLETLSAQEIVVGFSSSRGCPGRQHEIDIIQRHQAEGGFVNVDILAPTAIPLVNEQTATAILGARFYGRHDDGTTFDGIVDHYFQMVNGPGGWKICNFTAN